MDEKIELFLEKPVWVIDVLPEQVPAESRGQYFEIEHFWRMNDELDEFAEKLYRLLLKLNCYYDFDAVVRGKALRNPKPLELQRHLLNCMAPSQPPFFIFLDEDAAMLQWDGDDLCLSVYNPDERLRRLLTQLAHAEGLFFWQTKEG